MEKEISKCPSFVARMVSRLAVPPDLPEKLVKYYDCSSVYAKFSGVLLSSNGYFNCSGKIVIQVCKSCEESLSRDRSQSPPKFAIANGLYMGVLPSKFDDSSMSEHAMVNLAQSTKFLTVVRGGKHSSLRSHCYLFRADPPTPA